VIGCEDMDGDYEGVTGYGQQVYLLHHSIGLQGMDSEYTCCTTVLGCTCPGHRIIVGTRTPPSHTVAFPHRRSPFTPPRSPQCKLPPLSNGHVAEYGRGGGGRK
jgi:hypothetical protein